MKQEPLPQIYHVKDTDIPRFAYMLHVLAGDFLRESEFNMRTLATEVQPDTIAIMGKITCGCMMPWQHTVLPQTCTR